LPPFPIHFVFDIENYGTYEIRALGENGKGERVEIFVERE